MKFYQKSHLLKDRKEEIMKKILIITSGYHPVPAVEGGAIETLLDFYIAQNEKDSKDQLVVYSNWSAKLEEYQEEILETHTQYRYIHKETKKFKIKRIMRGIINKLLGIYVGNAYIVEIIQDLKKRKELEIYDDILIENEGKFAIILRKLINPKKTRIILHMHNDYLNNKTKKGKEIVENCDLVISVSKFIANQVITIDPKQKNKVVVVYNGIEIERFQKRKEEIELQKLKEKYQIKQDDFVFLFVGRLKEEKGVLELIKAYQNFTNQNNISCKLMICGEKDNGTEQYQNKLKEEAKKCKKKVIFTGKVEYQELPNIYQIANAQFVPSMWEEAFGLIVIEAMASQIPVVISRSGGMPELVDTKKTIIVERKNIITELEEAMKKITTDKNYCKELVEIQNKLVKNYTKEKFCDNLKEFL